MAWAGFKGLRAAVKALALAVGGSCTAVSFVSLVGAATANPWARGLLGIALTMVIPALAVDRALPKKNGPTERAPRPGFTGDVVALVWLGIALLFVGIGQPVTGPLLVREADRLAEGGHDIVARAVYLLAGVRPVDALPSRVPPPPHATTQGGT